nr:MAG TPA: hypothetical protein [Caudoviricetes sp.]
MFAECFISIPFVSVFCFDVCILPAVFNLVNTCGYIFI